MTAARPPFKVRLKEALVDDQMREALDRAFVSFRQRREGAFAPGEFEQVQQALGSRRAAGVDRLPQLVDKFRAAAEAAGAKVYLARNAEEARQVVGRICQENGARLVVKSKSMATEEIELNPYLEGLGIQVVETDLGEWIVQLAGEHPSHLIAPAVHWTRERVAELFGKKLGEEVPPDAAELVKVARRRLRQAFVDADVGITGANIAVAESGTIVMVTNEGNDRLVSTLPPVHIAVVGVDKIVPTLDDALEILKVLPRNATGQKLTSYVSFITGPSRTGDIELTLVTGVHGPREVHIVLLDNGRLAMQKDPDFRDALRCIRCAACSNVCPANLNLGGHAFGYIYTGPIGIVLTAWHHGTDAAEGPQSLCLSCNACETVCPVGIPIPRQILEIRTRLAQKKGIKFPKGFVLRQLADPARFEAAMRLGRVLQRPLVRDGYIRAVPFAGRLLRWRPLPKLADRFFREVFAGEFRGAVPVMPGSQALGLRVAYFPGCITDRLYPEMGLAAVRVLAATGARVVFGQPAPCCGLVAWNSGDRADARRMAKATVDALERVEADYFVSTSISCLGCIVQDYPYILRDEPDWAERARRVGAKFIDFISFLLKVAQIPPGAFRPAVGRVAYHDACQTYNALGLRQEPREVLSRLAGVEVAELRDRGMCCGFGGTFSLDYPEASDLILRRKLDQIAATGANTVLTDNPGCILQIRGGALARGLPWRVLHIAEFLAESLPEK
jgi:iron-sulfur cluster protein